jgi:hypothetical protein
VSECQETREGQEASTVFPLCNKAYKVERFVTVLFEERAKKLPPCSRYAKAYKVERFVTVLLAKKGALPFIKNNFKKKQEVSHYPADRWQFPKHFSNPR